MVPPENLQQLARRVDKIESESDKRHDENLGRFTKLEVAAAKISGEMRIIIALLVTNGALQLVQVVQMKK